MIHKKSPKEEQKTDTSDLSDMEFPSCKVCSKKYDLDVPNEWKFPFNLIWGHDLCKKCIYELKNSD